MSRTLKFRAWDSKAQVYGEPSGLTRSEDSEYSVPYVCLETFNDFLKIPERTWQTRFLVEQWTGLKDRAGRDIYEGDLISFTQRGFTHGPEPEDWTAQEVYYDSEVAAFLFGRQYGIGILDNIDVKTLEVTGNIHSIP